MTFKKLIRLCGTAAISSGIADIIGIFIIFIASYVPGIPGIASTVFLMAGNVLLAFALIGIYGCQFEKTGNLGLTGFVIALSGLLLGMAHLLRLLVTHGRLTRSPLGRHPARLQLGLRQGTAGPHGPCPLHRRREQYYQQDGAHQASPVAAAHPPVGVVLPRGP